MLTGLRGSPPRISKFASRGFHVLELELSGAVLLAILASMSSGNTVLTQVRAHLDTATTPAEGSRPTRETAPFRPRALTRRASNTPKMVVVPRCAQSTVIARSCPVVAQISNLRYDGLRRAGLRHYNQSLNPWRLSGTRDLPGSPAA